MLMIAISIVFSGRSTVSPSQDSRLFSRLLACLSIFFQSIIPYRNARNTSFTLQNY